MHDQSRALGRFGESTSGGEGCQPQIENGQSRCRQSSRELLQPAVNHSFIAALQGIEDLGLCVRSDRTSRGLYCHRFRYGCDIRILTEDASQAEEERVGSGDDPNKAIAEG